ncbi:MAG: class I SAM-dependent methyltransferase [Candidatus Sulfotelmatobacter sp.]|jgi:SAM-dependent methyltransferase
MRYELNRLDIALARFPNHPHHSVRHLAIKDEVLRAGGRSVLVLGCGKGIVEYLLPHGLSCTSVDIDPKEIEAAKELNRFLRGRCFMVGDIYNLPFARKFQTVIISEVIEHLGDDRGALLTAIECLEPNGVFILTVPNRLRFHNWLLRLFGREPFLMTPEHVREYTAPETKALLHAMGFDVLKHRGIWFEFPRPFAVEKIISPYSLIRSLLATLFPRWATYLLFVCRARG